MVWGMLTAVGTMGNHIGSTGIALMPAHNSQKKAAAYEQQGDLNKAGARYFKAIEKAERSDVNKFEVKRTLAALYLGRGRVLEGQRNFSEAENAYKSAYEYARAAVELKPSQPKIKQLVANTGYKYSSFLRSQGQEALADQLFEEVAQHSIQNPNCIGRVDPRQNVVRGTPLDRVDNPQFNQHMDGLQSSVSPFFTQQLQPAPALSYSVPTSGQIDLIQDTRHLAYCIQNMQQNIQNTRGTRGIVYNDHLRLGAWMGYAREVAQASPKGLARIQESVALASIDDSGLHRSITNALLGELEKSRLLDLSLLRGLSVMMLYRKNLEEDIYVSGDCVVVLKALLPLLQNIQVENNLEQVQTLLQTLSLVLDLMVSNNVVGLDRTVKDILNNVLNNRFKHASYPELIWLAEYSQKALADIPNNETFGQAAQRRAPSVVRGVLYLTAFGLKVGFSHGLAIIPEAVNPSLLLGAWDNFNKALRDIEWFKRAPVWYRELCFIDMLIMEGRLDLLGSLLAGKSNQPPCEAPFLRGLCDRLERLGCIQRDIEARDSALRLLKDFQSGRIAWARHESIPYCASESLRRVALMWPEPGTETLNIATMERYRYAPPAWHPFWDEPPSSPFLHRMQDKERRRAQQAAALQEFRAQRSSERREARGFWGLSGLSGGSSR